MQAAWSSRCAGNSTWHCRRRLERATALAAAGAWVIADLADLAFMDCYCLGEITAARAQARRAGGDVVLAGPQPIVLRLLVLCDVVSHGLVFTSVDEAVSGAWSTPAALVMPGPAGGAAASLARALITAASRKRHDEAGTH